MFIVLYLLAGVGVVLLYNIWIKSQRRPLPPGPKGLPIVGSIFELPRDYIWLHVAKHRETYGPISSVSILGETFIFLNDKEVAVDLLERRSSIYSDRPRWFFSSMCGFGDLIVNLPYGKTLQEKRRVAKSWFGLNNQGPVLEIETKRFIARILTSSGDLESHIRSFTAALILRLTYGYSMEREHSDPLVEDAEEAMRIFAAVIQPASWLVDSVPLLRYIPEWMPGSEFKRTARAWRKHMVNFVERPFLFVKQQMAKGEVRPSLVSWLLERSPGALSQYDESVYKWSAGSMYLAGAESTASLIHSFFLAMVLYPDVQKRAQAEIVEVIGSNRLPTQSDLGALPYVDAVYKEVLRWHNMAPLGIPHVVNEDNVYDGYLIPKGSTVFSNIWLYNHDPTSYQDPYEFKPERFLDINGSKPESDPSNTIFGFGRRICAGKKLAQATIFQVVATSLATLNINKARDANGQEITPVYEATGGLSCQPKPFPCSITARSSKARELIMSIDEDDDTARNDAAVFQAIPTNVAE